MGTVLSGSVFLSLHGSSLFCRNRRAAGFACYVVYLKKIFLKRDNGWKFSVCIFVFAGDIMRLKKDYQDEGVSYEKQL